jgi:condensin complex subunit 2
LELEPRSTPNTQTLADTATEKPKAKREKKEAFKIDFLTPPTKSLKEITEELFKPGKASINLAGTGPKSKKSKEKEVKNDYRLPDDMHFTSRQLVTLFLKPKFAVSWNQAFVVYENRLPFLAQNAWSYCRV